MVLELSQTLSLMDNYISKSFIQNHHQSMDEKAKYRSIDLLRVVSTHIVFEYIKRLSSHSDS